MRELFHYPDGTYLLSHSVGCMPVASQQALNAHLLEPWQTRGGDAWPAWLDAIGQFEQQLATLLDADVEGFCPQSNLSSAMVKFLQALPLQNKRKTILMHEDAFPTMGFVVTALAPMGLTLKLLEGDCADLDLWQQAMTEDVAAVLITHVHSNTGRVSPVKDLIALCAERGVFSMLDIAQSAGVMPMSLRDWQPDVVFGSCVKWLCGGPGAGFMWISQDTLAQCQPLDVGWFSHQNPFEFDIRCFTPADSAKRFWGGTPAVAPYVLAQSGIGTLLDIGVQRIHDHNRGLLQQSIDGLSGWLTHLPVLTHNGGTLCAAFDTRDADRLEPALCAANIRFDRRGDVFRLSWHIYNTSDEVDGLIAVVHDTLGG